MKITKILEQLTLEQRSFCQEGPLDEFRSGTQIQVALKCRFGSLPEVMLFGQKLKMFGTFYVCDDEKVTGGRNIADIFFFTFSKVNMNEFGTNKYMLFLKLWKHSEDSQAHCRTRNMYNELVFF